MLGWRTSHPREAHGDEPLAARLARRFAALQEVLAANASALEMISELEADLLLVPVGDIRVRERVELLLERTAVLLEALGRLTDGRYHELQTVHAAIRSEVTEILAAVERSQADNFTFALADVAGKQESLAGNKALCLARLLTSGFPVPDGFVLSTAAYHQLAHAADLTQLVRTELRGLDVDDPGALERASERLRRQLTTAPVSPQVDVDIRAQLRRMMCNTKETFAVRSSAVGEDGSLSFAGQFDSRVHVPQEQLASAYREVCASRFTARALAYRASSGVAEADCPMAVLFLRMVRARSSGVVYTRDPASPRLDGLMVTASWGVGFSGALPGDRFLVSRGRRHPVLFRQVGHKNVCGTLAPDGGVREETMAPGLATIACVSDDELSALAELALRIERFFRAPQDIEWAIDEAGTIWILQARVLRVEPDRTRSLRAPKTSPLMAGGITIFPGRASGPVHIAPSAREIGRVPDGAIVVLQHTGPECVSFLPRVNGLIVDFGNPAGHAAALVREYRVPAIFEAGEATRILAGTDAVSLDAGARRVYPGLLFATDSRERARKRSSRPMHPLAERVTSLGLLDPNAWSFRASSCRSLHDIIRFAHEKAIQTVFSLGDEEAEQGRPATYLLASDVPIELHVLDLGGGVALETVRDRRIGPAAITSLAFQALWRGMTHPEVSWVGREYVSLSGFASVVARAITDRANESRELGARSYVAVGPGYVNFNSRLAYHYAMVDACVEDTQSSNFINFRFKGGGTDSYRKNLRARFLQACMQHFGFTVDVRHDLVTAWLRRYPRAETEERLDMLGRLMACSRQLDMFMADEASMRWHVDQFLAGNYRFRVTGNAPASVTQRRPSTTREDA
jgi:pyruvate,water dikinase